MRVGIIDYGACNMASVANAVYAAGADPIVIATPDEVLSADRLLLPGVGAAASGLAKLRARGLEAPLKEAVTARGTPLLGICLGMQMMAERLHEYGESTGLGFVRGDVRHISTIPGADRRVPHMGWAEVETGPAAPEGFIRSQREASFYFCHSYVLDACADHVVAARVAHGAAGLVAAICSGNVLGTQFHPEKSQMNGMRLLEFFLDWAP